MNKVMVIFGTRPEAIKLAPVINQLRTRPSEFEVRVCVTAQHRQMLDQVLNLFSIRPDYDLNVMTRQQDLFDITTKSLEGLKPILKKEQPDLILVQGDTTTTFAASLAAFYLRIPIGHVEAGLRTYHKYQPFPEEKNRHMATVLADFHFAPTEWSKANLIRENIPEKQIWVTGNTGIDALLEVVKIYNSPLQEKPVEEYFRTTWNFSPGANGKKLILITGHRRENFGKGFQNICGALKEIARRNPDVMLVYPVHLNPHVRKPVFEILGPEAASGVGGAGSVHLIEPLDYAPFVYLMNKSYIILTDSGGIQEEAPSLGKPILVMRNTTERPEGVEAGVVKLVGTDKERIVAESQRLLHDPEAYASMSRKTNPYGDGQAAKRISEILSKEL